MSRLTVMLAMAAGLMLAACSSTSEPGVPLIKPPAYNSFEQQHQKEAKRLTAEGDLAEAAFHWEVLTVLRPDLPEYSEKLAQTRAEIDRKLPDLLRAARQAQQKGALEDAMQRYLAVLALQPNEKSAAQGLRAIERERVKRDQLGKYSSRQLQPRMPLAAPRKPAGGVGLGGATSGPAYGATNGASNANTSGVTNGTSGTPPAGRGAPTAAQPVITSRP